LYCSVVTNDTTDGQANMVQCVVSPCTETPHVLTNVLVHLKVAEKTHIVSAIEAESYIFQFQLKLCYSADQNLSGWQGVWCRRTAAVEQFASFVAFNWVLYSSGVFRRRLQIFLLTYL